MFRKLIFAGSLGLALLASDPAATEAADSTRAVSLHSRFEVWVRADHHHPWRLYGTYHSHHAADDASHHLRHHGYETHIDTN